MAGLFSTTAVPTSIPLVATSRPSALRSASNAGYGRSLHPPVSATFSPGMAPHPTPRSCFTTLVVESSRKSMEHTPPPALRSASSSGITSFSLTMAPHSNCTSTVRHRLQLELALFPSLAQLELERNQVAERSHLKEQYRKLPSMITSSAARESQRTTQPLTSLPSHPSTPR